MPHPQAIDRNRTALLVVLATVAALIGGREGAGPIARRLRQAALALLRPAEAAARRLIVVAARGLAVTLRAPRAFPAGLILRSFNTLRTQDEAACGRIPAFPLFDRWKRFRSMLVRARPLGTPRIRSFGGGPLVLAPVFAPAAPLPLSPAKNARPDPDAPVDAARLRLRLRALERALSDLPRQARRLARWNARRAVLRQAQDEGSKGGLPIRSPLRPGRPPGWRQRPDRDVDHVLRDCHLLACQVLNDAAMRPNTS